MDINNFPNKMIREAQTVLQECKSIVATFRQGQFAHWESLAGNLLPQMLENRDFAEQQLMHTDANVRIVSMEILSHHWARDKRLADLCRDIALTDPHVGVRSAAV